jgi:hypothetical protein
LQKDGKDFFQFCSLLRREGLQKIQRRRVLPAVPFPPGPAEDIKALFFRGGPWAEP